MLIKCNERADLKGVSIGVLVGVASAQRSKQVRPLRSRVRKQVSVQSEPPGVF
jgi:hypothetical protein